MSVILANLGLILGGLAILILIVVIATGYVKAPPDTAFIISGLRKKTVIGKSSIKIPFLERLDKLTLQLIQIDVKTSNSVPTADYINVIADGNVNVKVSSNPELLSIAAENFLNKDVSDIAKVAREVLEGNMREIIGQMTLEEMVNDRKKFAEMVAENAGPDFRAMGLEIVSFNVQNFSDEQGLIENLGIDNTVKIQKKAAIAKADAEKEIAIAQAKAQKDANDAQVAADTEIAKKKNELAIQKAELKKQADIKKAEADAAYQIQEQEQRKTVETTTADANLAKLEKEIELKERNVAITEKALEAEIKKKAEAEKYARQQEAEARLIETQKAAEADLFERQKSAEAKKNEIERQAEAQKVQAEREAEAKKVAAEATLYEEQQKAEARKAAALAQQAAMEAEAAGIKAKGEAEAAALLAKAEAEAEGILKKAEAMKQYGDAAKMDMQIEALKVYFEQLPAIAGAIAAPMSQIDKITMYGEGNTAKLTGDIMTTLNQVNDGLKGSTGIDIQSILGGVLGSKLIEKKED